MFISMHSILGWASFCMNYCINAARHGVDQSVSLLRCNEAQVLQVICIVGSGVIDSLGFRSGEFAGQSSTVTQVLSVIVYVTNNKEPWTLNHDHWTSFWYLWQCGQVSSPAGKWNQHLHKACQQKEAWSALTCPGRCCIDCGLQKTQWTKSPLTVETSHWTSSNMDSVSLHSSSRLWDLDLQIKCTIYFNL